MLIPEPIVKSGFFFTPSNSDDKYPGTLTISEGGRAELEITSTKVAFISFNETEIGRLIGEVEGGYVTLEGCTYRTMSFPFGATPEKSLITAETVFDGVGFDELPPFSSLRFCIDGLSEWLGASAFQINHAKSFEDTTITMQRPEEVRCTLPDGTALEINIEMKVPGSIKFPTTELFQQAYIVVKPTEPKPLKFFQKLSHQLTRFFSFTIGKTVAIHSLNADFEDDELSDFQKRVRVYFRSLNGTDKAEFSRREMLLGYRRLAPRLEALLGAWLNDYDNLMPALHHHYSVQDGSHRYADTKFLAIAQAVEAFHRRTFDTRKWPKVEYKEKVRAILAGCPEDERVWLNGKLAHGNEISLAERLHQLIDRFGAVFGDEDAIHQIVRGTVNTRNYHAHYDPLGEAKALKGAALVALTYRLRVLFTLSLLVRLGYTEEEAIKVADFDYLKRMLSTANAIHGAGDYEGI
ncbi:HEPN domain-containing protein [Pseudomonas sp. KB_15]|uniref:ApeA N-terminal domain 1-containing protein n=1 Tax=Pseudomonas sp. KB_15 TaxID=3233035 RepID=UPI003F9B990A